MNNKSCYCCIADYSPVTGQSQTLTVERSTHVSLHWLIRVWRKPHLLKSFQWFNVSVDFFEFSSTELAACLKSPSRDNVCKAFYRRTYQRILSEHASTWSGWGLNPDRAIRVLKRRLCPLDHAVDKQSWEFDFLDLRWVSKKSAAWPRG